MPRKRDQDAPRVVYRTARCGLRLTRHQRARVFGLLRSAGDVWCAVLELAAWRRHRQDPPLVGYLELCRELARSGPGTFGELDSAGARSVLRRYSDAWFAAAKRRKAGDTSARFPRRKRALVPVRWYHGTFRLDGRVLAIPVARGCPPLTVRLDRDVPYLPARVRSVTLGCDAGRRHNQRTRDWRIGHLIRVLSDKAQAAGISVHLADERGTSSTCPNCARRVPKPAGRNFTCPHCGQQGPPRPGRGGQHRRPRAGRRHHPRSPARAGDHAPSRRSPPSRCAPRAA